MKVTGIQLREAIKRWELRSATAASQFDGSIWAFDGDETPDPRALADEYRTSQEAVARIQTAQARYNMLVTLDVGGGDSKISLCEAVKRLGGAGRLEKMWRSAAGNTGRDRYSLRENMRSKDNEYAKRRATPAECVALANEASKVASKLRTMIALGNTAEVEMENLDPALFE